MWRSIKLLRSIYCAFGMIVWDKQGKIRPILVIYSMGVTTLKLIVFTIHTYSIFLTLSASALSKTELFTIYLECAVLGIHVLVSVVNTFWNTKFMHRELAFSNHNDFTAVTEVTYGQILSMQVLTIVHFTIQVFISGFIVLCVGIITPLYILQVILVNLLQNAIYFVDQYPILIMFIMSRVLRNANEKFSTGQLAAKQLRIIHHRLSALSLEISYRFQLQMVTTISSACIYIVTETFKIVRILVSDGIGTSMWLVVYALEMVHAIIKLWSLGRFCQDTAEEVIII